jgi:prolyl-tRNA synthetase
MDYAGAVISYRKMMLAYMRTFQRLGVKAIPMEAESGPIGGNLSHEFIILAPTGESQVWYDAAFEAMDFSRTSVSHTSEAELERFFTQMTTPYAATDEKHDAAAWAHVENKREGRGIEVGHIFYFGTKYSEPMKALVAGSDGIEHPVHMGSYGIGPSRLVAAIIEAFHDDAGIKWPEPVAPFQVVILNLKQGASETDQACEQLYAALVAKGIDTLYHDLDERPGAKFATADLIGIPWQILVGPRGLAEGKVELKRRSDGVRELMTPADALVRFGAAPGA